MAQILTQPQAAALMGITPRRLRQKDKEDNPPPKDANGQYPAEQFGKWLDARAMSRVKFGADGEAFDYETERARLTKNQADEKELQVSQLRGDLIPSDVVLEEWTDMLGSMRARLLALPPRLANKAIAATGLREIENFARVEVYAALDELANVDTRDQGESAPDNCATAPTYS